MIHSDQVNYIVWRYLCESGFDHAAFSLKNEMRNADDLDRQWATRVPTGHLVNSLQRALMFEECLAQLDENGVEKEASEVIPSSLIPGVKGTSMTAAAIAGAANGTVKRKINTAAASAEGDKRRRTPPASPNGTSAAATSAMNGAKDVVMTDVARAPAQPKYPVKQLTDSDTISLEGHVDIVDHCLWHPSERQSLLTGSADGTVRMWQLPTKQGDAASSTTFSCLPSRTTDKSVTAIAWNNAGTMIAAGSFDGALRLWQAQNNMPVASPARFHTGPIFAVKFNKKGDALLTASGDGLIASWNTAAMTQPMQRWDLKSPVLDVEWIADALFISGSKDGRLFLWQLGRETSIRQFDGHQQDINVLKWNAVINLGATCSDDTTVRVWRADQAGATQVLQNHRSQVQSIEWAPNASGDKRLLASCSRDGQACIWDVVRGDLLHVLHHDRSLFTLSFSPARNLLACAGQAGEVSLWDADTGKMLATYKTQGMLHSVKFSNEGGRLALGRQRPTGAVLMLPAL
ncbi:WD40-repeat-containing domain protein [Protomyces lactucae-debilis]|uniref:WD40-repeat-containing domain protein n=1 Tax=Protomyces lactucae-debilis TaxID=2754530 RepID=A0A1Y2FDH5_PROLT|nr:WD40-repeat-containing domain protein [Protomyces lactucae-debilis]ORY80905.1 WD40-repeat-containing domain protein [Protomyces lactucae-debilis]